MHYRMLITLAAEATATSESVRREAYDRLSQDDSFCGSGGRFGSPLCDWFVIGGRWSGVLAEGQIGDGYRRELHAQLPGMAGPYIRDSYIRENATTLSRIWVAHGGTGPNPFLRSSYEELGAEDDAWPLTEQLLDTLLAAYQGVAEFRGDPGHCEYADLDHEPLTGDAIGRKWVVVVDYHN